MSVALKNGTGTPRKQLSERLARLDGVIDALDEGLKGAVADAVRDALGAAVNEAVQAVLMQVLTNPELQRAMRQAAAPEPVPPEKEAGKGGKGDRETRKPPGLLSRAWARVRSAARACCSGAATALTAARLAWLLAGSRVKALALAACAAAAGALWAGRSRIASAASAA